MKSVLITGTSSGLGMQIKNSFLAKGWRVIGLNRSVCIPNPADPTKSQQTSADTIGRFIDFKCDLRDLDNIEQVCDSVTNTLTGLDILINNAGIHGYVGQIADLDLNRFLDATIVNFVSPAIICKKFLPLIRKNKGSIINLSGGGAVSPREGFVSYSTSKAALVKFTEMLAEENQKFGVNVNAIAPGPLPTKLLKEVLVDRFAAGLDREFIAAKSAFEDKDDRFKPVLELIDFLSGDESKDITGRLISAKWDQWKNWKEHISQINAGELYTVRRVTARDKGYDWGDK